VIVSQADLDAILDRKVRKRLLELPVRHGKFGELKRCPTRVGKVERLYPPIPFERFLARAGEQPSHARSVLWLIDRVQRWDPKPTTITVRQVDRESETWIIHFIRGDEREAFDDTGVYLSADGGFTTVASRQSVPGDPEYLAPLAEDLARARLAAREKRLTPAQLLVSRMAADAERCRDVMVTVKAGNRANLIRKELFKLQAELALDSGAILDASDRAARQAPVDDQDEPRPSGTGSELRPSPAQLSE